MAEQHVWEGEYRGSSFGDLIVSNEGEFIIVEEIVENAGIPTGKHVRITVEVLD